MCEPATIAAVAMGASAIGAGVSAYSQVAAGDNARDVANYNAEMQRRAALDARQRGAVDAAEKQQQTGQLIARQHAGMASGGIDTASGTPLGLMTDSAGMGQLDALRILTNAQRQAAGLTATADLETARGDAAQSAGYLGAAGTLLTAPSRLAGGYYGMKRIKG